MRKKCWRALHGVGLGLGLGSGVGVGFAVVGAAVGLGVALAVLVGFAFGGATAAVGANVAAPLGDAVGLSTGPATVVNSVGVGSSPRPVSVVAPAVGAADEEVSVPDAVGAAPYPM